MNHPRQPFMSSLRLAVWFWLLGLFSATATTPSLPPPPTPTGNLQCASSTIYLYAGEQFDPDLGLYYNRARYLNTGTGRFWNRDSFEGHQRDPRSLHKYLYCHDDPVMLVDPSGHDGELVSALTAVSITVNLSSAFQNIQAKRYAWAAVDILSAGLGGSGLIGPGAFKQLAFVGSAANAAAVTTAAARAAMQVSQAWAGVELFMMANSITPTGGGSSGSSSSPSGSGRINLDPNDAAIGLVKDGQIAKWIKYSDYSDPFTLPSHESLATLLNLLKQRGVLQEGVEAFTVGKGPGGVLQIRGSGNFNIEVSPATRTLLEQTFQ